MFALPRRCNCNITLRRRCHRGINPVNSVNPVAVAAVPPLAAFPSGLSNLQWGGEPRVLGGDVGARDDLDGRRDGRVAQPSRAGPSSTRSNTTSGAAPVSVSAASSPAVSVRDCGLPTTNGRPSSTGWRPAQWTGGLFRPGAREVRGACAPARTAQEPAELRRRVRTLACYRQQALVADREGMLADFDVILTPTTPAVLPTHLGPC
jgi:hypothetical protein